ncbi:MAG TPA: carbohydrate porin [Gammaproteobacteria bacterium]|nr:carbohydrate porin [Gammaproteobacteria bacterium]
MIEKKVAALAAALTMAAGFSAPALADSTTVHGEMFTDFSWLDQQQDGQDTNLSGYGLDVKRFYLGVEHAFDDSWSADITTDFNYKRQDGETQVYVKKAYVQASFSPAAIFRAGSAAMPWIPFAEHIYGYRYVDEVIVDRLNFGNSYDWGIHLGGKTAGILSYQTALVNGGGYKNPTRNHGMDVAARVSVQPVDGLIFALGGYSGHRGMDFADAPANRTATRIDALAAYVQEAFRVGAECFRASNWNHVTTVKPDSANGYSIFASFAVGWNMSIFGRYDRANLSRSLNPSLTDEYYNFGAAWQVRNNIDIALVYKHENRSSNNSELRTAEIGVAAKIKF